MSPESPTLDDVDLALINRLMEDGRASFSDLGKAVGLSPHGAADRVRRLQRNGVITGFSARVELANVGRTLDAFIDVRLAPSTSSEAFESFALALAAVREVAFVTGRYDFELRVACRGPEDLDATVRAIRREGGAAATETRIVMRATVSAQPLPLSRTGT
ncbi:Lrp/AsnC family transcriptional regulator [Conexibacter sp. DBS9H8]|uniref:Lrp/AsnC family transcriptional regulator n=1 Tax=Conexibacter sp. DBS9H8 TaxID=2937801 RepID=UPI00200D7C73|nr:Lrp/AsnC family transcriptional regulator [Conexibacter sp. DBS9H8]